eukprot:TRINITY_DN4230_c0_g1_i1.p1 TRINITY_DN4230_c0_g1~~TRINITY_DN4230_c0_g1_i1.p1  ORF type:complete len:236 (+),score=49.39 TRINITY_DN4230_c0_g1_i1:84-710(+)
MSNLPSFTDRTNLFNTKNRVDIDFVEAGSDEDYDVDIDYRMNPEELNRPTVTSTVLRSAVPARLRNQTDDFVRSKSNSTSTLFVSSTIDSPNVSNIVLCLGRALYYHLKKSDGKPPPKSIIQKVFSEAEHPLNDEIDLENAPELHDINEFIGVIFQGEQLSAECAVMSLAYIDRLLSLTDLYLHASNWRRITLGAIILASKGKEFFLF